MRPPHTPYGNCEKCKVPVIWIRTASDKRIPVLRADLRGGIVQPAEIFDRSVHVAHHRAQCDGKSTGPSAAIAAGAAARKPATAAPQAKAKVPEPIFGLTLAQPLAWAVTWAGLRELPIHWTPSTMPPWLAIHAGPDYDAAAAERFPTAPPPAKLPRDHVVAVARVEACTEGRWLIKPALAVHPVPCPSGGAALWMLPTGILTLVREVARSAKRDPVQPQDQEPLLPTGLPYDQ